MINRRRDVSLGAISLVNNAIVELDYVHARRGRPSGRKGRNGANGRRTNRLALLVPGVPRALMHSPVYIDVLHGVEAAVRESGKTFLLTHLPPDAPCPARLFPQQVDGVVLFGTTNNPRLQAKLRTMACAQVMGMILRDGPWDHVSYDNGKLGQIAAHYLLARGHRHTAIISNTSTRDFFVERSRMSQMAMVTASGSVLGLVDDRLLDGSGQVQQVVPDCMRALLDALLAASPRPTAVFLVGDILAPGLYSELQRRGLVPGRELDVVSCNNEQLLLSHLHPRPTTIDIHAERVGRKAVEQLLWRIEHPHDPRVTVALEPTLVEGESA